MLICNECGEVFQDDEVKVECEHHPYGMGTAAEEFQYCPYCGGDDIEEAHQCLRCGEYFAFSALEYVGKGLHCEVCADDLYG